MAFLAGRPPFATDIPDSAYAQSQPQARNRQPPRDDPNARTSAYNHYDAYLNGGNNHSNDRATRTRNAAHATVAQSALQQAPVPLVAPKPGYAAPITALSMPQLSPSPDTTRFPPGIDPKRMQLDQYGAPYMQPAAVTRPRPPPAAPISVPSTPHPLPPTMTPILPVFARPSMATQPHNLKWGPEPILRGNSEEKLLPRRGEQGDDFWRRFSMVIREENTKPYSQKQSAWLRETQSGMNRLSIWVWIVGLIFFSCAGLGIGVGWYLSHKSAPHQDPTAIGGGADISMISTSSQALGGSATALSSPHVTPTNTIAQRAAFHGSMPTPPPSAPVHVILIPHPHGSKHDSAPSHHRRRHLKRAIV
ncbi:hypothetical protein BJV74DRAFT_377454 [Russula compacta]|nr:hypothetical protein BJV74DRAFT_377454 [Russula compacta]